jgi:multiple sugar transport system permease protein
VIVPLAAPGVFTTAIIAFFIAWNDFVYGIVLTSTERARPVPAALGLFSGASQFEDPNGPIARPPSSSRSRRRPGADLPAAHRRRLTNGAVKG